MKTKEEKERLVLALQISKQDKSVQLWINELKKIKDAVSIGAFNSKDDSEAFKNIGVIKGLDIAINLDEFVNNGGK